MSIVVSGYMIAIPLGMWVEVEARFMLVGGRIERVFAQIADSAGALAEVPSKVRPLVDAYFESWLLYSDGYGEYVVNGWLDRDFWQDTTLERLEALAAEGLAEELHEEG